MTRLAARGTVDFDGPAWVKNLGQIKFKNQTVRLEGQLWKKLSICFGYCMCNCTCSLVSTTDFLEYRCLTLNCHHKILAITVPVNRNYSYQTGPLTLCLQQWYNCLLKWFNWQLSDLLSSAVYTFSFSFLIWNHL